jgi:Rps23 Pro-64 3,4-dihydroxylase Tpa1-like proline 4-hydroxylase
MPPWHCFADFLPETDHRSLLDWTLSNRERFVPSTLRGGVVDPERRISERLRDLGPLTAVFETRLREMLPEILRRTGSRPFEVEAFELELAAHGDGAFFAKHSDIPIGPGRAPLGGDGTGGLDRLISAVYYFHSEPKGFSGGALRLYRFGGGDGPDDFVDIEPRQNSLVVFPSWAMHEVLKISCPNGDFRDWRFAVNAWFCKVLKP